MSDEAVEQAVLDLAERVKVLEQAVKTLAESNRKLMAWRHRDDAE